MPSIETLTPRLKWMLAALAVVAAVAGLWTLTRESENDLAQELIKGDLAAAEQLATMGTARAGKELARVVRTAPPKPSAAAVIALARMDDFPQRNEIILESTEHSQPETRQAAAIAIRVISRRRKRSDLHDPPNTESVQKLLKDAHPGVRASAATTLAKLDAFYSVPQLIDAIVDEQTPGTLRAMKRALVQITHYQHFTFPSDKNALRKELNSYLPDWRYSNAVRALDAKYKLSTSTTQVAVPDNEIPTAPDSP